MLCGGLPVVTKFIKLLSCKNPLYKWNTKLLYSIGRWVWERWDGLLKDQYSPLLWLGFLKDPYEQEIFSTIAWDLPRIIYDQFSTFMKLWEINLLTNTRGWSILKPKIRNQICVYYVYSYICCLLNYFRLSFNIFRFYFFLSEIYCVYNSYPYVNHILINHQI